MAFDFKKEEKLYYATDGKPRILQIPAMKFLRVKGQGNPNSAQSYKEAVELLYGLSYALKMNKQGEHCPVGYFEYVVPPLEGLWWLEDEEFQGVTDAVKDRFHWYSMIRQPDFITEEAFIYAKETLLKKKPGIQVELAELVEYEEGEVIQCSHLGPYDTEPETLKGMLAFMEQEGYVEDFSDTRLHHELYMSDPRKTAPEKWKTILRHPVRKATHA